MRKKNNKVCSSDEDLQAVIAMIPKLQCLIKVHKEIAEHYQMYRQNGGEEIPGIERHLPFKERTCKVCEKTKKTEKTAKTKAKKTNKKDN